MGSGLGLGRPQTPTKTQTLALAVGRTLGSGRKPKRVGSADGLCISMGMARAALIGHAPKSSADDSTPPTVKTSSEVVSRALSRLGLGLGLGLGRVRVS